MDSEFRIPLVREDLLHCQTHGQYVVREVISLRVLPAKFQESQEAQSRDGCKFILDHFDTFYSILVLSKQLETRPLHLAFSQTIRGMEQLCDCLSNTFGNEILSEVRHEMLNIAKMSMYIFEELIRDIEDRKSSECMLVKTKGRKKNATSLEEEQYIETKDCALVTLHRFLQLPLWKLWDPPVAEEEFVNLASNVCYKLLEDPFVSFSKMKKTREKIFQILGSLITHYQHGLSCTVKIVQLLKLYDHLCGPLAEGVVVFVRDYGCCGFIREVIREISVSESLYDVNGAKSFSLFLTEIAKHASDLILPIMSLLIPYLDCDPFTMRNCVLDILGEIVIQTLSSESLEAQQRETRDMFLNHLQEHLLDNNAHVRSKALKTWQRLSQEGAIPLSRCCDLLSDIVERLGDSSWTVVRNTLQLLKTMLENNPFGAKMDLSTLSDKLAAEEKQLESLRAEANNVQSMTRPNRWANILPAVTLAVEMGLKESPNRELTESDQLEDYGMNEEDMMKMMQQVSLNIDKGDYIGALKLVRKTEEMFPGAEQLRKDNRIEWQVDYFLRLMKKIYVEMVMDELAEKREENDKENQQGSSDKESMRNKKAKKRKLHPDDDTPPEPSDAVKALEMQTKIVQYLMDSIGFAEKMLEAVKTACSLLHCGQTPVVQDAIEFFSASYLFGFDEAKCGVKQMLLLVWNGEQTIRESVAAAYKRLYLQSKSEIPGSRIRAVEIVHNLCKLLEGLSQNEQAALEIIVQEWISSNAIDKSCIQVMWERFTSKLEDTTAEESLSALQLLTMVAVSEPQIILTNIEVLEQVGLGKKGQRDNVLIRDTCRAFLKAIPNNKPNIALDVGPLRYDQKHSFFTTLLEIMRDGFCDVKDCSYQQMAEEALDVIFQFSEKPDVTCENLLQDLVNVLSDESQSHCIEGDKSELHSSQTCQAELLSRLIFFIGHVAYRQWVHLDKSIFQELKRRNQMREQHAEQNKNAKVKKTRVKQKRKDGKDQSVENSVLSASHILMEKLDADNEEIGGDIAADDAEAEYINNICETEIVTGVSSLSKLSTVVVAVCANPHKYSDLHLQATASLALTKLMLVSSVFCEQHLQLVFTMMEKSVEPRIRSNLVYAIGDLANRFPNLIEPWTKHIYSRLRDTSPQVRQDTMLVLKHLITNEMIKVRGQISDLALCIVDPELKISNMANQLFQELSKKGNTLYNVMPDIISRLSNPNSEVPEDQFQIIMKFLIQLIQKDRQMESLVDKLCQRFRASTNERQWLDLAFCLGLMQYSDRSLRRLLENLPCYAEKLTVPTISDTFKHILLIAGKTQKPERLRVIEELQAKINECLSKGLPPDQKKENGSEDPDSQEGGATSGVPIRKRKPSLRTPATARGRRRRGHAGRTRHQSSSSNGSSADSDLEGTRRKPMVRGTCGPGQSGRKAAMLADESDGSDSEDFSKKKSARRRLR